MRKGEKMQRYNPMTKCLETVKTNDRKTVDAGYDSPSQMESKLKNYLAKAKRANSKQELEKINNDLFFYVIKLKSNVLKKHGTTNNKFNSTEEWDKNYSKLASKYMSELQRLVDNFKVKDHKTVDADDIELLFRRAEKDAKTINDILSAIKRNKEWKFTDERMRKNINTLIVMLEKSIDMLGEYRYRINMLK